MKPGVGRGAPESRKLYSWGTGVENPVGQARAVVCAEFARLGVPGDVAENAVLAVSELVANAVEHACGPYVVSLRQTGRELLCEVHDGCCRMPVVTSVLSSVPFEPREVDRGGGLDALCEALSERGRGLGIVNYLSRGSWGVRRTSGGKCIWVDVRSCNN
ncbi:ATP-binding protein [Streptomyces sp. NPDC054866]